MLADVLKFRLCVVTVRSERDALKSVLLVQQNDCNLCN